MKAKVEVFDRDAAINDGYVYTTAQRLSSRLATRKLSDLILGAVDFGGKTVLDIGCGDGYFTERYWDEGHPERIVGVDPAPAAVKVAQERRPDAGRTFMVGDGHRLPWRDGSFDLALIQGVLHHDDRPVETIREAFRLAGEVLILEPHDSNMGLREIGNAYRYHRETHERSYPTGGLLRWVRECGGVVVHQEFGGVAAMFWSDWIARTAKTLEPRVEHSPVLRYLGCAVLVVVARRGPAGSGS